MPLRESRLQSIMWMVFLAGLGAFIAGQAFLAIAAVLAVAAIAFSAAQTSKGSEAKKSSNDDLVASN